MNESILDSIKGLMDISEGDDSFDSDIMTYINSALYSLRQLGVGPKDGFTIHDAKTTWSDFLDDPSLMGEVKTYIQQKVRLLFDPPNNSFLVNAIQDNLKELEWRLYEHGEGALDD